VSAIEPTARCRNARRSWPESNAWPVSAAYLPKAAKPADTAEAAAIGSETSTIGRGYRVLVVEDNDDVGQFSTELLEDLGYAVRRVVNADAALAILAKAEFSADLVFSDVIMPGTNDVELAGVIRERYPGLPVVLTSGYSGRECRSRLRTHSEALFGRVAVADSAEGDFRTKPHGSEAVNPSAIRINRSRP